VPYTALTFLDLGTQLAFRAVQRRNFQNVVPELQFRHTPARRRQKGGGRCPPELKFRLHTRHPASRIPAMFLPSG